VPPGPQLHEKNSFLSDVNHIPFTEEDALSRNYLIARGSLKGSLVVLHGIPNEAYEYVLVLTS
jgi:hypothetical protein